MTALSELIGTTQAADARTDDNDPLGSICGLLVCGGASARHGGQRSGAGQLESVAARNGLGSMGVVGVGHGIAHLSFSRLVETRKDGLLTTPRCTLRIS